MPRWEYLQVHIAWDVNTKKWVCEVGEGRSHDMAATFGALGDRGWELVNVVPEGWSGSLQVAGPITHGADSRLTGASDGGVIAYRAFFKRPRADAPP